METKEINDTISFVTNIVFDICNGILIDPKLIDYIVDQISDESVKEHVRDIINNILITKEHE